MSKTKNMIPKDARASIAKELGKKSDAEIARKWSQKLGMPVDRHAIFWMRTQAGIEACDPKPYTKPEFRGRFEDAHPEVKKLFGRVPFAVIADKYHVSRSCVRDAARRCGYRGGRVSFRKVINELLADAE